ncbi:MAG: tetratricopeptide repeat protein [Cyanobacteriota bacterium]|nr:tetratricopeptide repeat protein [Cyanobacteriota bacterium]
MPSFLRFFYPEIHNSINWTKPPISLDKELEEITASATTEKRYADKLFQVWLLDDQEIWILIHIEIQSQYDREFSQRMFIYNYRAFDLYNKPVISLAILGDEIPSWRPSYYEYGLEKSRMRLDFSIVKLLDYEWEELSANNNVFAMIVMAHLKTKSTTSNLTEIERWKWELVRSLYERGLSKFDIINLFKFIDKMMALPPELQQNLESKINQYEEEQKMEFLSTMEERAMERDQQIGEEIGAKETCRQNILDLLQMRFLSVPETLVETMNNIEDLARLKQLLLETFSVNSVLCFRPVLLNCLCHADKFQEFTDLYLTFHIGNQESWKSDKFQDYAKHNKYEAQKIFDHYFNKKLLPNHPLIEERFSQFMNAEPLIDAAFKAQITAPETLAAAPGEKVEIEVTVKNISSEIWPAGYISQIKLGNHWLDENGEKIQNDDGRTALPQLLKPTESIKLPLTITIPETPGNYLLELDMVQEGVAWFEDKGSQTTRVKVEVNPSLTEEKLSALPKAQSSPIPSVELPADATAQDYYQLGQKLEEEKQLEPALKAYQKAIEIEPNNFWYQYSLANIFRKQNQFQQAITAYENAMKINPNFSWSYYYLGGILQQQGKIKEAISAYQTAVELYPNFKVYQSKLESLS